LQSAALIIGLSFIAAPALAQQPQPKSPEVAFWESVRDSKDANEIEAYLKAYPNGQFVPLARIRLNKLKGEVTGEIEGPRKSEQVMVQPAEPGKPTKATVTVRLGERAGMKRGLMGVQLVGVSSALAQAFGLENAEGAIVIAVTPNGAAEVAGIRPTDVLVELGGQPVRNIFDVTATIAAMRPGDTVRVTMLRLAASPQVLADHLNGRAAQGETDAAFALAWLHSVSAVPERDDALAARLARFAADKNHAGAMLLLGNFYESGRGVPKSEAEFVNWVRKAAEHDEANAISALGSLYVNGRGVAKDPAEALRWYGKAAEKGHPAAMYEMGISYANGRGVAKDEAMAVVWYRKAAEKNFPDAVASLGWMYENGFGVFQDYAQAERWYRKAADLNQSGAMFRLGTMALDGRGLAKSDVEAVNWFRLSADLNNTAAMASLGLMYSSGRGVDRNDAEAARLFRKAAEGGSVPGMFYLGLAYERGQGVPNDFSESALWYRKAADNGDLAAMHNLGAFYDKGRGVKKDERAAAQWVFKAIKGGSAFSVAQMTDNSNAYSREFRREMQRLLAQSGVYNGATDGRFGPDTKAAVKALARQAGQKS
jgi:TPR repeat protein